MRLRDAAIVVAVVVAAPPARADLCATPDLIDAFPADGAEDVPMNAVLTAHYAPTAEYVDEEIKVHGPDPGGSDITVGFKPDATCVNPVAGSFCFNKNEGLLNLRLPPDLGPGGYTVEWPRLRGLGTASRGDGRKVTFTVVGGEDLEPPDFEGLQKIFFDLDRDHDECTNAQLDRFYFELTPGRVSDDFDTKLLALRIFQSKGPTVRPGKPRKIDLVPFPDGGDAVRVYLSVGDASGDVCFAAQAEDLKCPDDTCTGKASNGADKQVCVSTTAPPFFYGCAVIRAPESAPSTVRAWPLALLLLLAARRRHRPDS